MSTEQIQEDTGAVSFLDMSDEDIMKMSAPPEVAASSTETSTEEKPANEPDATGSGEGDQSGETAAGAADQDEDNTTGNTGEAEAGEVDAGADGGTPASKAETDPAKADDKPKEAAKEEAKAVDYEAEYKRLLAPFKANGRDVQVASVDDAINLMQMGANYNKKMAALKPNLKILKMLEHHELLDEEKLSFLIDLDKKKPEAINKLVKDSGIDPMDLSAEKASAYKQTAYAVDEREIELDTVLDEIQGSQTYTRTLDVVSNKWDAASKQVVLQAPQLLKVIDGHMANGIYDLISTEIERERMFGRLTGVSDIDAYRQIGDSIQARGGFNHLFQGKPKEQGQPQSAAPVVVQPKPKVDDAALKDKKRAASSTKPAAPSTTPKDFNPLAMSDEEFSKVSQPQFK